MAKSEKLEYSIKMPIESSGAKDFEQSIDRIEKKLNKLVKTTNKFNLSKVAHNAQSAAARIGWGAASKPGTMGRTIGNIASKNLMDFLPVNSFARKGSEIGRNLAKDSFKRAHPFVEGMNKKSYAGMVGSAGRGGAAMGGAAGGALGAVVTLLPAFLALVVASSKMLQKTLGNILKYLLMFLRPIGDMLAVLFYPLMMILRPIALMVNTIIRPFLMEARKSFRLALQLGKQAKTAKGLGMTESADALEAASADMWSTALATLGMGFAKLVVNVSGELIKVLAGTIIDVFTLQFGLLAGVIDAVTGGIFGLQDKLKSLTNGAKDFINSNVDKAVESFNNYADEFLTNVREKNEGVNKLASYTGTLLSNISTYGGDVPKFDAALSDLWTNFKDKGTVAMDALISKAEALVKISKPSESGGKLNIKDALLDFKTLPSSIFDEEVKRLNAAGGMIDNDKSNSNQGIDFGKLAGSIVGAFAGTAGTINPLVDLYNRFSDIINPAKDVKQKLTDLVNPFYSLQLMVSSTQEAIKALHGYGGQGIVELQAAVAENIVGMTMFNSKVVNTISAIDSALSACKNAEISAKAAASAAQTAANSAKASVSTSKTVKGTKAIGGSIDENGMYYLHRGETVVNPIASSFDNSSGGSSSPSIEFNNCVFGSTADWKKEMDKYFNAQMRHIR